MFRVTLLNVFKCVQVRSIQRFSCTSRNDFSFFFLHMYFFKRLEMFAYAYFHYHIINLFQRLISYAFRTQSCFHSKWCCCCYRLPCCYARVHNFVYYRTGKQLNILFLAQFYSFGTNSTDCHKNELFNMSKSPIKYMHHKQPYRND